MPEWLVTFVEPHTKNGVSTAARPVTLAYHSLLNRTNRVDTHAGLYIVHPKSVHRGYKYPRHTPAAYIYTPVGVTSAIVFDRDLNFRRSSHQKQSVQCRLFRNAVLQPMAPSSSENFVAIIDRSRCKDKQLF